MNRRDALLALIVLGATPLRAEVQSRIWRVGYLVGGVRVRYYDEFPRAMRELGYQQGKNLTVEWRYANGQYQRLPALAAELVGKKVDIIVTASTPATKAAKQATVTIPIVMSLVGDPVASGFVASLARPGGNITGLSLATTDTSAKWLELAKSVAPKSSVAILANPDQQTAAWHIGNIQVAAKKMGSNVFPVFVPSAGDIERAFETMARDRAEVVIILPDGMFDSNRKAIAQLALKFRMASIATTRANAEDGALVSYGQDYAAFTRLAARYVDKIFKGAKPADLPVEQPIKFELIINMKTAKALGLKVPQSVLVRADRVIE